MNNYDVAIIGAGICGCSLAYELHKRGKKVLVFEKKGIASGGSGAAGAFINPKISRSGPLKELIEEAYLYSLGFYTKNFNQHTTAAPLLHISKYTDDNEKVQYFKDHTNLQTADLPSQTRARLKTHALSFSSVFLKDSAIVEAKDICQEMLEGVKVVYDRLDRPEQKDGVWCLNDYKADKIVLCTGAYEEVFKEPYISLRAVYGQRCEVLSASFMEATVHHEVSVSATKKNGRIAIGASHYLNEKELPIDAEGAKELIDLALKSVDLEDVKIQKTFSGMRSGSNDYLPIMGALVDAQKSLLYGPSALKGDKEAGLVFVENVYMINGVGGYGFVLAPYLAHLMAEYLVYEKKIPEFLEPKRFYYRYAKKEGHRK